VSLFSIPFWVRCWENKFSIKSKEKKQFSKVYYFKYISMFEVQYNICPKEQINISRLIHSIYYYSRL
jgi:hypothetical protein